ncbi:hypothetical protein Bca4012_019504 [Brassica carinata]|uniref:Uncharacterized protein n=1 Tax=Brassica carinata TaxID=52824 RepID=A0A8X7WJK8_BRACI|nr:hypothetical protein Bca52824_002099 [Brassica carinata]
MVLLLLLLWRLIKLKAWSNRLDLVLIMAQDSNYPILTAGGMEQHQDFGSYGQQHNHIVGHMERYGQAVRKKLRAKEGGVVSKTVTGARREESDDVEAVTPEVDDMDVE